jgi:hypothetical protein
MNNIMFPKNQKKKNKKNKIDKKRKEGKDFNSTSISIPFSFLFNNLINNSSTPPFNTLFS